MTEGTTNPPGRYTEGTLIDQMDKKGLGTVATRADIIDKLFNSYLLEKKEMKFISHPKESSY